MGKLAFTGVDHYKGMGRAMQISNGKLEVVVTLDLGPRIIKFALAGGQNILEDDIKPEAPISKDKWWIYGGHRLWHSPEALPRTYMPDNDPLEKYELLEDGIRMYQKEEPWVHIQKSMEVHLLEDRVRIQNTLVNKGAWPIDLSVWSITIASKGGREVIPVVQRDTGLLPNKSVVLWPYSRFTDQRVCWGERYYIVDNEPQIKNPFKLGLPNEYGWAAYFNHDCCFIKKYNHVMDAVYPDGGCSWETYTADWGIELESLSPFGTLKPGESATHTDEWFLFGNVKKPGVSEDEIDSVLAPLAKKADIQLP